MSAATTVGRLSAFQAAWISNPAARAEFLRVVLEVLALPDDHEWVVRDWLQHERAALRSIGIP